MTAEEQVQLFNNALAEVGHPPAARIGRDVDGSPTMVIVTNAIRDNATIYQAYRTGVLTLGHVPLCRACYDHRRDITRRPRGMRPTQTQFEQGRAIEEACWGTPECPGL